MTAKNQVSIENSVYLSGVNPADTDNNLPALSVAIFCESETLLNAAGQCSADRRLRRSTVSIYNGSVKEAINVYQESVTPNVLIVECRKNISGVLAELASLSEVCDSATRVIIIGSVNDINLYRELIKQGVSEYLVSPVSALRLINSIGELYTDPETAPCARTIGFIGSSGGAGSSTIAQNVAVTLSRDFSASVILADFNFSFGTVGLNFNAEGKRSLADMIEAEGADENVLTGVLTNVNDKLKLATSPADPGCEKLFSPELYEKISVYSRNLCDYVVYDMPSGALTGEIFDTLLTCEEIFITVLPNVIGVRNAAKLFEKLVELRPNDPAPHLIINQKGAPERSEINLKTVTQTVGKHPNFIINYDGELFERALSEGSDLYTVDSGAQPVAVIRECAAFLTGKTTVRQASGGLKKILGGLFGGGTS